MRLGICCGVGEAEAALEAGFAYAEVPARDLAVAEHFGGRFEATNLFFPDGARLFGAEAFDWRGYVGRLLELAAAAQVQAMVIGSSQARHSAKGQASGEAEAAFLDIAAEIQTMASPFGITIAPESLNRGETDVWNDPAGLASALQARGMGYTLDTYHALREWSDRGSAETIDADFVARELTVLPAHVHLADLERAVPAFDDPLIGLLLGRLRGLGFDGRISFEGELATDLDEANRRLRDSLAAYL